MVSFICDKVYKKGLKVIFLQFINITLTQKQNDEILKEAKKAVSFVFDKCFLITWCKDNEEINQYFKDNINNFIILKNNIKNNEYLNKFSETVLKLYNEEQNKQASEYEDQKNKLYEEIKEKQKRKIRNTILKHHRETERDDEKRVIKEEIKETNDEIIEKIKILLNKLEKQKNS